MKTSLRIIATVSALALLLAACGKTPKSDVAASVNGVAITNERLALVEPVLRALLKANDQSCVPEGSTATDCSAFALTLIIQAEVVRQIGDDVAATASDVNAVMDQFAQGDDAALAKLLSDGGATMDGLRDLARTQVLMQNGQRYFAEIQDEDAIRQYYEENKSQFATINTAHILLKTEQEADDLLPQVTTDNFGELAKRFSTDPSAKQNSGDLGSIEASGLVPEYSNAVLAAEEGQIIGPVQSEFGWHIIWVKGIEAPKFEDVKAQLEQQGPQVAFQSWITKQVAESDIEVNPRYGTLDPKTGQVVPVSSTSADTVPQNPEESP